MPRRRRRPGSSRFLVPAAMGGILLAGIASVLAGTVVAPSPAGAVAGIQGGAQHSAIPGSATQPGLPPRPAASDGGPAAPIDSATLVPAGLSLEERTEAAARPSPPSQLRGYRWPLPHGRITLPFGPSVWGSRIVAGEPFHDGLDLATFCGDRIVAAHTGVVLAAGRHYDTEMGWLGDLTPYLDRLEAKHLWTTLPIVVVIGDGNGYRSLYAHLSKAVVQVGESVEAGELIGYEGNTGRASGCHLHFGLFSPRETARFGIDPEVVDRMLLPAWQTARIDPLLVLPPRPGGPADASRGPSSQGAGGAKPPLE